ncbi:hypothetical protein KC669_02665, partial [Candidatus Dojkabacteria bacterium]|nr:hypothetical protein [Candidatus Dojkabacteria bacterium]
MKTITKLLTILSFILIIPAVIILIKKLVNDEELDFDLPFDNKDVKPKRNESSMIKKDSLSKVKKEVKKAVNSVVDTINDLSERQKEVYDFIMKNGEVEMSKLSSKFNSVSPRTLRRDLT